MGFHKRQPLDRSIFGPFKSHYHKAMNNWMNSPGNAGKTVTIYNVCEIAGRSYESFVYSKKLNKWFQSCVNCATQ
ncbi:hypothetical protein PR048_010697 [Dryococelus australis]|uniref:Uncharacterized protein n=1 Tax=Dryococelus australis TaxID=614101 RepID=A0ABQ9I3F4_9NEOP|nr:hypothetical protein PR048_010697 [Dryococelus australis]